MRRRRGKPPKGLPKTRYSSDKIGVMVYFPRDEAVVVRKAAEALNISYGEFCRACVVDAFKKRFKPPRPRKQIRSSSQPS